MALAKTMPNIGDERERTKRQMRLEIVVASHCRTCRQARWVAMDLQQRLPNLAVEMIELDGRQPVPTQVVATPTYLLDGAVTALGNPKREDLERAIARRREGMR